MLRWTLLFFLLSLAAAIFGFGGLAADFAWIAKVLFVVFVVFFGVSLVLGRRQVPA